MSRSKRRADTPLMVYVAWVLLIATAAIIAVIVLTPGPPDPAGQVRLSLWLDEQHRTWMPGWITFRVVEFASNVVMFLPLGLFAALAVRRRRWLVVPACAAISASVELIQWIALPARDGSWLDLIANTLGAAMGYAVAGLVLRYATRNRPQLTG